MANVYVGTSSAGSANGTSWANRYGTLNAAEDRPLSAGDVVYVGPGAYRELLTIDVSGSAGNPITYIGDYTGANTDGVGGVVRITGAANETSVGTRASCIVASLTRTHRTFRGFLMDGTSSSAISIVSPQSWIIEQCVIIGSANTSVVAISGASQLDNIIRNSVIVSDLSGTSQFLIGISHTGTVDNTNQLIEGCLLLGGDRGINNARIGGVTVRNCTVRNCVTGIRVGTALTVGQVMTVNNCILTGLQTALNATTTAEFSENYNTIMAATARSNVSAGANSVTYPPGFDMRPFFNAFGAGTLVLPLASLASYSGLVEYSAGTGAPSTDWRGHAVAGSLREWGCEEYVSTYTAAAGGGVTMWPLSQSFIQGIIGAG